MVETYRNPSSLFSSILECEVSEEGCPTISVNNDGKESSLLRSTAVYTSNNPNDLDRKVTINIETTAYILVIVVFVVIQNHNKLLVSGCGGGGGSNIKKSWVETVCSCNLVQTPTLHAFGITSSWTSARKGTNTQAIGIPFDSSTGNMI